MKPARWLAIGVVLISAVTLLVDLYFRSVVLAADKGDRAAVIASNGILLWRRTVHLACSAGAVARIVTKVHVEWRDPSRLGARSKGGFHLAAWQRRARADVQLDTQMTITGVNWFDTLESDPLDLEALKKIAAGLSNPELDFVGVHGFEHGFYFERSGSVDLRPIERCLSQ